MDRISTDWDIKERIGECVPSINKCVFLDIENKILDLSKKYKLRSKFNVNINVAGIPPIGDKTKIVNPSVKSLAYHDVLGGILISTRNGEVNSRLIDHILFNKYIDNSLVEKVKEKIEDKYKLNDFEKDFPNEVIFLTGSNIRHIVNKDLINKIISNNSECKVKPHPIQTEIGYEDLKKEYGDKLIDKDTSGYQLLKNCSRAWTTYNSEIGLMASLFKINFGTIMNWKYAYECVYSPIYRHLRYDKINNNFEVMSKIISSKISGLVFPWEDDWEERIESYVENITNEWEVGTSHPYLKK